MLKKFVPEDIVSSLRSSAVGIAFLVLGSAAFIFASSTILRAFETQFASMTASSWASPPHDEAKDPYVPGQRYDLSSHGVSIPPARNDRTKETEGKNAPQSADHYQRGCYEQAYTIEESDLCAQWSNAAAVRFGNRIALEAFRLNSWLAFLSALGVFLASIGVVLAGMASLQASRGLNMISYGFMPALGFVVHTLTNDRVSLTVRNAGTGPATDIWISVNGDKVVLQQDRIGSGAQFTCEYSVTGAELNISAICLDLSKKRHSFDQRLILLGCDWVVSEGQP